MTVPVPSPCGLGFGGSAVDAMLEEREQFRKFRKEVLVLV
jgi:hypothetical protein